MNTLPRAACAGSALLIIGLAPVAQAAVYRCVVEGRAIYTDRPCAVGATEHPLPELGAMPSGEASGLARQHDERRQRERESRAQDDAAWLESHAQRKAQEARMEAAIRDRQVLKGMNSEQVRRALGSPDQVERRPGGERWVFGSGRNTRTVEFENAQVVRMGGRGK